MYMIELIGQSINKGSSLVFEVPVKLPDFLEGGKVSAYCKAKRSDGKAIALDADFNPAKTLVRITISASRSSTFPIGRMIYFVEVSRGIHKDSASEYLLVEP